MRRRSIWLAMLGAAVALGLVVATAAALSPPPGTPDLSKMTIQAGDLAPGAKVDAAGYTTPPKNFTAVYDRNFSSAKTPAGLTLFGLDTEVLLGNTEAVATGYYALQRRVYGSKAGRSLLKKGLKSLVGKGVTIGDVRFEKLRRLALGSEAFVQPVLLKVKHINVATDILVLRDGSVASSVSFVLTDPTRTLSTANQLGKDIVKHITAVLAASGPSGPTGSSGATGPTGAT